MQRKVEYYKAGFELIKVICTPECAKSPLFSVAIHFMPDGFVQAITASPLRLGAGITEMQLEQFKLWNFIQEKNWRRRLNEYPDFAANRF